MEMNVNRFSFGVVLVFTLTVSGLTAGGDKRFQNRLEPSGRGKRRPPPDPERDCAPGGIQRLVHGQLEVISPVQAEWVSVSEESWQRLQPVVECEDDAMTLTVRRRPAAQLQLDRESESSVPLSQLPPQCGSSVQTTFRDLSLRVLFDGCHVKLEDDRFVLPLVWRGAPVRASCLVSQVRPRDSVLSPPCCSASHMTVDVQRPSAAEQLRVNVLGQWRPLLDSAEQCGYVLDRRRAEVVITAPFGSCGVTVEDGKHSLSLRVGPETFTLSCPVSRDERTQELPLGVSHHGTGELREAQSEPTEPFPWAPPFFLAPPYYPHPVYRHKDPDVLKAFNPQPSWPDPAFDPQPLPDSLNFPHLQVPYPVDPPSPHGSSSATGEMKEPPVLSDPESSSSPALSFQTEEPSLQPPSQAFNPYYYPHPKRPLPGQNPEPALPVCVQDSDVNSNQFPVIPTLPSPESLPTSPEPLVSHPPPQFVAHPFFSFFPRSASGDANHVAPPRPDVAAGINVSHVDFLPHNVIPFIPPRDHVKNHDALHDFAPEPGNGPVPGAALWPGFPPEPHPDAVPPVNWRSAPTSTSGHSSPPHPFPFYPYSYYYGPGVSKQQPPASIKPPFHVPYSLLNPHYYHPGATADRRDLHPRDCKNAEAGLLTVDMETDPLAPAEETGPVGLPPPQYGPVHSFYPQQHHHDPHAHPSGRPRACVPPCVLSHVSDFNCGDSLGCCWFPVHDCTMGRYFVVALPDCVQDPTLARPAPPPGGSDAPCVLEKLPSTAGVYTVPLDGCGVSKHVFGDAMVYLLDVNAVVSHPGEPVSVRLMVECRSVPGSTGEVRLHVVDPPPPAPQFAPSKVKVQLRITTDRSFSSFHPQAHLPLSLLRGRPLFLEVSLLDPPEPDLRVLVHSCLAYAHTPLLSWMPVYKSCSSHSDPQPLPPPHSSSHHVQRITVSTFLALPSESPSDKTREGSSDRLDPEIYFLCLTEVCSAADAGCTTSCTHSPNSEK